MNPSKPFKTIDQQLEMLRGRGLEIADPDACSAYLLTNNYYSVVNGYKALLLDPDRTNQDREVYREGTDLMHLVLLHKFDRMLRTATLGSMKRAPWLHEQIVILMKLDGDPLVRSND